MDEGTEKEQIHPAYGAPFSINAKMKVVIQIYPLQSGTYHHNENGERETMAAICASHPTP